MSHGETLFLCRKVRIIFEGKYVSVFSISENYILDRPFQKNITGLTYGEIVEKEPLLLWTHYVDKYLEKLVSGFNQTHSDYQIQVENVGNVGRECIVLLIMCRSAKAHRPVRFCRLTISRNASHRETHFHNCIGQTDTFRLCGAGQRVRRDRPGFGR